MKKRVFVTNIQGQTKVFDNVVKVSNYDHQEIIVITCLDEAGMPSFFDFEESDIVNLTITYPED